MQKLNPLFSILTLAFALAGCSSSTTNPSPGPGNGGDGGGSEFGTRNDGGSSSAGSGKQGDACPCNSDGFCMSSGSNSGCSGSLECIGQARSATCVTPCDSDAASPSANCPSGTTCTVVFYQGAETGSWCK